MKRLLLALLLLASTASAATLSGSLELRLQSVLQSLTTRGNTSDVIDYAKTADYSSNGSGGAITLVYSGDATVGTSATTLNLSSGLSDPLGTSLTFTAVNGLYLENTTSTGTITVSGLATGTIPPSGAMAMIGSFTVASFGSTLSLTSTATTTARVWIVGN